MFGGKKISKEKYFVWVKKLYEIHISVSLNKVILEHSHAHSLTCCLWLLSRYDSGGESLLQREHMAHKAPNIYYLPLYRKCFCSPTSHLGYFKGKKDTTFFLFLPTLTG